MFNVDHYIPLAYFVNDDRTSGLLLWSLRTSASCVLLVETFLWWDAF